MDNSDSKIMFDEHGVCDHCNDFKKNIAPTWKINEESEKNIFEITKRIKREGKNNEFDCIIGMSGGADSSYLLHLAVKKFKLRPLVFHVDGGWNSKIAVNNIKVIIEKLNLDLHTEVINWEEMKEFQLGYFRSGLSNIDVPQDHAFVSTLYNFADKHNIRYILNGGNISTEVVRNPLEWVYYGTDMRQINYILNNFVNRKMRTYPFSSVLRHKVWLRFFKNVKVIKPLNFVEYNKTKAMQFLEDEYGWMPYPQKHFESRFTKFYEGYWLPKRFGFDTRRVQFSSLILTDQLSREEALKMLEKPAMTEEEAQVEIEYVSNKLDISKEELIKYLEMPLKNYSDYPNSLAMFDLGAKFLKMLGLEASIKR